MKVLLVDKVNDNLEKLLINENFIVKKDYHSPKSKIEKIVDNYQGIVIRNRFLIDKEFILKAKNLKFIARFGAGIENIDIDFAKKKNITVINSPEGNRQAVGEHTLGMLLSLSKRIIRSNNQIKQKNIWEREQNRGFEISDKTVGIIGYGNMGSSFAKCINGLGANVVSYDIKKNYADNFTKEVELEDIFNNCDVVSIHTPLTKITNQMCDDSFFQKFKKNIYFLNTARGKIVNTKDLIENIKKGKVVGAGLDVLEYEKKSFEGLETNKEIEFLKNDDRIILTSHIGGWSFESNEKMGRIIFEKIKKIK